MLRRQFLGWQLAAMLGVCAAGGAQEPASKADSNRNAALLYWQAYGQLSYLPEAEREVMDYYYFDREKAPAKARQEVFRKTADVAKTIHRAAGMPGCDWDEDLSQGDSPTTPRVNMCRGLARFLAFRAKHQFEQGQPRAAVDDLLAGFMLARHTAANDTIVGMLVGIAIESIIESACLDHLHEMDPATLDALQAGLARLPPRPTWKAILAQDKRRLDVWLIPQFAATGDPEAWKATLRRMYPDDPPVVDKKASPKSSNGKADPPKVQPPVWSGRLQASVLIERFGTREALVQYLQEGRQVLDEMAQFPFPPPGKISPTLMAKLEEMPKGSPLYNEYCSLQPASYRGYSRAAVQLQLLRAAIAVQRHGPDALKDYPDPSGDGPFEYRKRTEGFELVSQFRHPSSGWERFSLKVGPLAKGEARFW